MNTNTRLKNILKHADGITNIIYDIEDELDGIDSNLLATLGERVDELKRAKESLWKEAKRATSPACAGEGR